MQGFYSIENLSADDRALFNLYGRGADVSIPHGVIHRAFEETARNHPRIIAVRHHNGSTISYAELDRRANILANELIHRFNLQKGDRVLLVYSRGIEMVICILAVLKAGAQYVPLDGAVTPNETLSHIITNSTTPLILCLPKFRSKVEQSIPKSRSEKVAVVEVSSESELWQYGNRTQPNVDVNSEDGAYIIYTSGTTGKPKGVDVSHGNLTNALLVEPSKLGIAVGKNVIQQLNVAFDMGAWEILATVMNGGTLHIRGSGNAAWAECLRRVDTVIATPSVLLRHVPNQTKFPNIKTIVVGGEPCPQALADHWAPHANFWNICGPTEITILNSAHLHQPGLTLSIGKPIPNTNAYLLDENEEPVRIGEVGDMWVGGSGVSRGYLGLPELTATRYKLDKFTKDGRMMFNTGDLARWLPDGSMEPLGRRDDQVKISGFRVELDGVARSIEKHSQITKACALKIDTKLWGFYSGPKPIEEQALKDGLVDVLPFYSIPTVWRYVATIALTPNGKVDKKKLRNFAAADAEQALAMTAEWKDISTPELSEVSPSASSTSIAAISTTSASSISGSDDSFNEKETGKEIAVVTRATAGVSSDLELHKPTTEYDLPEKNGIHGWRWLRHKGMSTYRRLFGLIFLANIIPFAILLWRSREYNWSLPLPDLTTAVAANLLGSVLLRQDHVVNLIYYLATRLPTSTPLFIRRHFARVYHNGGVHSGCAVSASIWWLIFSVEATRYHIREFPHPDRHYHVNTAMMVITFLVLGLLLLILGMAYPTVRARIHDQFEWTHRFAGWTTLVLVWVHLVVATVSFEHGNPNIGSALAKNPSLYLIALITISIASPWLRLRKVKVVAEPLSKHAVRLHFDFFTPRTSSSAAVRITDRPMVEWHAFAAIFEPGKKGFSLIVSRAGDWTGRIIDNPPTSIWTRGTPASGVLAIAPLFKKIVLVATGSGIGPCMPVILENRVPCRILWSTKNPLKTYGQEIIDNIYKTDPNAVIWDTDELGRPDMVKLAYQIYRESGAECVCVISNARVTAKVVYGMESRGVPAFGPVFDS